MMIQTPAGPVAVWNVHFYPPFMYPVDVHDQQLAALIGDIETTTNPLIVAGDFNVTDQSDAYQQLNAYLNNAHERAGWGFGFSFPAAPHKKGLPIAPGPIYRLDHVFYNRHFVAYHAATLTQSGGSDHLPVIAELQLSR